jgi:hypothetical protein
MKNNLNQSHARPRPLDTNCREVHWLSSGFDVSDQSLDNKQTSDKVSIEAKYHRIVQEQD